MKLKTSELIGAPLEWAVAQAAGITTRWQHHFITKEEICVPADWDIAEDWCPSIDWAQGGPIIEREKIDVVFRPGDKLPGFWDAYGAGTPHGFSAPTPLVAAMRCYVASKLGDEVDVPKELL